MAQVALPAPRSWTAGVDLVTSAYLNGIRDGIDHAQQPPRFMAHQSITQTISDQTWTRVSMDTLDITDGYFTAGGGWSSGSPTVYTCQMSGRYLCEASVSMQQTANQFLYVGGVFYVTPSGGSPTQVSVGSVSGCYAATSGFLQPVVNLARPIYLNAGDQLAVAVWQHYTNAPGALTTSVSGAGPSFLAATWQATT